MRLLINKLLLVKISIAVIATIIFTWELLQPGFVLTLDWVPGHFSNFSYSNINHYSYISTNALIHAVSFFIPTVIIQKIILFVMIFCLFYIPLNFFPWQKFKLAPYFTAQFFAINPFVYERLLAGQWRVLVGYICLFPIIYYLLQFCRIPTLRHAMYLFATLLFTGMWSIHFLAIGIVVSSITLLIYFGRQVFEDGVRSIQKSFKYIAIASCLFLLCSLYWIIPLYILGSNQLDNFNSDDYLAFTTTKDPQLGVVVNVLTLRGFWATGEAWGTQFSHPGDNPQMFYVAFIIFIGLVLFGGYTLLKQKIYHREVYTFIIIFVCATVFATGVSAYGLWAINYFLYEHIPFWNGFRDAQKWAGVLAYVYAVFAGIGFATLCAYFPKFKFSISASAILVALALSPYQLFGLGGQVKPVWYPQEWTDIDLILKDTDKCTAVFLPWHQYYAVSWNQGQLVANPGNRAFTCTIITSQNTELGTIKLSGTLSERDQNIDAAVTANSFETESISTSIQKLKAAGVQYIIYSTDIADTDIYLYQILKSTELEIVYDSDTIKLYKIK